jgi:hypothetical protein
MRAALLCAAIAVPLVFLCACTSSGDPAPTVTDTHTMVGTRTQSTGPIRPVPTGPTTAARAASCPLIPTQEAANRVGMRLERITVLDSGGKVVGCRFYALQNSPLHNSEHLPGPNQPAIAIDTTQYASSVAAHNAFVLDARRGKNPQQATFGRTTGVCFQIAFYKPDHGRDWACTFSHGATKIAVRTVATASLDAVSLTRAVARNV